MKLKWETNSRVKSLASMGLIQSEDIIDRTSTDNFPANAITVRMKDVRAEKPWVTLHIRGEAKQHRYVTLPSGVRGASWESYPKTARIHFGHVYNDYSLSRELDGQLSLKEIGEALEKVQRLMSY